MSKEYREKVKEIFKYSNPVEVQKKAEKLFGDDVMLELSNRKDKKYMIYDEVKNKWVHFGSFNPPMEDFTKHKDPIRRERYLARATKIKGNWKDNPYSPNMLSINLLW